MDHIERIKTFRAVISNFGAINEEVIRFLQ